MKGRKITALLETKDTWVVAACEDGTLWLNTQGMENPEWKEIQGPPAPEPGEWGTSRASLHG